MKATPRILNLLANETFRSATSVRAAAINRPARDAVFTESARESSATSASGTFQIILTREMSRIRNGRPNMMWNAASFELPRLPTEVMRAPTMRLVRAIMTADAAAAQPNTANVLRESEKSLVNPTMMKYAATDFSQTLESWCRLSDFHSLNGRMNIAQPVNRMSRKPTGLLTARANSPFIRTIARAAPESSSITYRFGTPQTIAASN